MPCIADGTPPIRKPPAAPMPVFSPTFSVRSWFGSTKCCFATLPNPAPPPSSNASLPVSPTSVLVAVPTPAMMPPLPAVLPSPLTRAFSIAEPPGTNLPVANESAAAAGSATLAASKANSCLRLLTASSLPSVLATASMKSLFCTHAASGFAIDDLYTSAATSEPCNTEPAPNAVLAPTLDAVAPTASKAAWLAGPAACAARKPRPATANLAAAPMPPIVTSEPKLLATVSSANAASPTVSPKAVVAVSTNPSAALIFLSRAAIFFFSGSLYSLRKISSARSAFSSK